jgi:three-Cys-motif partner protein
MSTFHEKPFDESTLAKLSIFRGYIREWLSVFMTKPTYAQSNYKAELQIFDYFAGPGYDADENPGSPVIITEEIKRYCFLMSDFKAKVNMNLFFNDVDPVNINLLKKNISKIACEKGCCHFKYATKEFSDIFDKSLPLIKQKDVSNLIIMDQFGVKQVTPLIVRTLADCKKTDILFFISSSIIKRFHELPEIKDRFKVNLEEVKNLEYKTIHRYVCDYYRDCINDENYYLAPFSIQKGTNIYGIIFGSSNLLGLEKFLKICWENDQKTGEANYNIDNDGCYNGQVSLFDCDNQFKKINQFQNELIEFIKRDTPDNNMVYKYCLLKGFSVPKANEVLSSLQKEGRFQSCEIKTGILARKGSFYLGYNYFKQEPKIKFKAN